MAPTSMAVRSRSMRLRIASVEAAVVVATAAVAGAAGAATDTHTLRLRSLPAKPGAPPRRESVRANVYQKAQLGTEPDVLKVLVETLAPDGVMFELSR